MKRLLVTGGAGFIGSNFVRTVFSHGGWQVQVLDKLTYAGHLENLTDVQANPHYSFVEADIADFESVTAAITNFSPDAVVNFAAETHVDRSIDDPSPFIQSNIVGVFNLLEASRQHWQRCNEQSRRLFRFLHISTDEVYGSLGHTGKFSEASAYAPNSPYSASKASADHLVRAYWETYGLPTLTTNCSNNYGPYQFPEKLIPLMTLNACEGKPLPIYGDGGNVRDWLYVIDHCEGLLHTLQEGRPGEKYNIGGNCELTNLELVDALCGALEALRPAAENASLQAHGVARYIDLKQFVADRPGHDRRYAIDASKIEHELGWRPRFTLAQGLMATVQWFVENPSWCAAVQAQTAEGSARSRHGLKRQA